MSKDQLCFNKCVNCYDANIDDLVDIFNLFFVLKSARKMALLSTYTPSKNDEYNLTKFNNKIQGADYINFNAKCPFLINIKSNIYSCKTIPKINDLATQYTSEFLIDEYMVGYIFSPNFTEWDKLCEVFGRTPKGDLVLGNLLGYPECKNWKKSKFGITIIINLKDKNNDKIISFELYSFKINNNKIPNKDDELLLYKKLLTSITIKLKKKTLIFDSIEYILKKKKMVNGKRKISKEILKRFS
jgi:hypothetical protein